MRVGVHSPSGLVLRMGLGALLALAFALLFLGSPSTGHAAVSFTSYECETPPPQGCQLPCPTEASYHIQPVTSYVLTINQTGGTGTYVAHDIEPTSKEDCAVATSATTWRVAQLCTFHCQHWHTYIQPGGTPFPGSATVTPTADAGFYFLGWVGGPDSCAPVNPLSGTTRLSCSVLMDMNRTLTAAYGTAPDSMPPTSPPALSSPGTGPFTVQLAWTGSADETWLGGYELYRNGTLYKRYPAGQNSVTLTNQLCNTHYQFRIDAFDSANATPSNTLDVTTGACIVPHVKRINTQIHFVCYKGRTCTGYPKHTTRSRQVLFHWGAVRAGKEVTRGVTYVCKLDRRIWRKCRPGFYGLMYRHLRLGSHLFRVKAHDKYGWDPHAARWAWKIVR
jgi:hypothetical protein